MKITFEGPALFVSDIKKSRTFYEELLEQKVLADFGPNIPFESGFSIWQAEHATNVIFAGKKTPPSKLGQANLEMYFECVNLDEIWEKIEKKWDDIIQPIETAPWGQRGFRLRDPDGHIVEISEPLTVLVQRMLKSGMSVEEIAASTSMPVEMVKGMTD